MNLYKFTHIPLLKNDGQLKQKSDKQPKKKKTRSNFHEKKNAMCLAPKKEAEILFSSLNFHPILTLVPTF